MMNIDQINQSPIHKGKISIRAALLLTVGIFLISAPAPDTGILADMTSNLIVTTYDAALESDSPLI